MGGQVGQGGNTVVNPYADLFGLDPNAPTSGQQILILDLQPTK